MAEATTAPVKTFSIGFEHEQFDELRHARRVAQLFGTEHHEFVVRPDAIAIASNIVRHYGEPFADSSAIPCFYLSELTRRHVTVALNGDGGDESFGGYTRYVANRFAGTLDRIPQSLRMLAGTSGSPVGNGDPATLSNKVRRLRSSLPLEPEHRYRRYVSWFDDAERESLYSQAFSASLTTRSAGEVICAPCEAPPRAT